ncbi:ectonucleotide pyrophosphatase/phosphodiesterase [Fulvivirgaceae bacterium BMA10]|uniref:Ectonucleotide pyrophosphatase/phosphodiesterase n=1 Tax=Splendidivirga corallicola TaxID=3051826 RepID=A0ABT8KUF3_9BACT|nr:ectonucleotide pyrophosphatase/phosphodiesterase [Fulvivirgaceae bacterium BMA10]
MIKKILGKKGLFVLFLLIDVTCFSQNKSERPANHVILISIDGFRPDFYLEEKWPAPNLKQMVKDGVCAEGVRSVFPSVTYPSHTTIITGALPAKHGIFYNSPFESNGQTGKWYWETELIKIPTLWHAVKQAGMKSANFRWPVSVGAPVDYNIPEVWSLEDGYGRIQPMRDHEFPKGLLAEMEQEVLGKMNERTFNGDYLNREDRIGEMAAYVLEIYKPNFMTIHLTATDHFQHEQGREGPKVYTSLAASDRAIGKIIESAERSGILENTTFVVVGDHGFVNIHAALSPNVWLVEEGLMEDSKDRGNWKAAFHTSGASAFLMLKDPKDKATLQLVTKKLNSLPEKYKKLFKIVDRKALNEIGADPNAMLALAPNPGIAMSSSTNGDVLKKRAGGTHGYFPDFKEIETGFVAWGAGIGKGKEIHHMRLEDIAPLIRHLLNIDFETPDGVLYKGILERE